MRIVLTGSSGRIGRAIYNALAADHDVIGIDRIPFGTTAVVGDLVDGELLEHAMEGADAVIHAAALHAPHVDTVADRTGQAQLLGEGADVEVLRVGID